MISSFKKILSLIVTGSCSIVFAACYGPPARLENPKQINTKDVDNQAIQGLKVTLFENNKAINEQFTNQLGIAEFDFAQKDQTTYTALIEDVDGEENGSFQSKSVDLTKDSFVAIKLDRAE
jgi:hypothetical protein